MMFVFFEPFIKPGIFLILNCFLAAIIIVLAFYLGDSKPYVEKVSAYECGFEPDEDARNVFDVRFYIIAMLFLIFDLEAIFFFP
jgi:NADH-quinone oxidoreductase subunit A